MLGKHKNETTKKKSAFARFTRTFVSMALISVFVLSVAYGIKFLSENDPSTQFGDLSSRIPADTKVGEVAGVLTQKLEENKLSNEDTALENESLVAENEENSTESREIRADSTRNDVTSKPAPASANMSDSDTVVSILGDSHNDSQNLQKALQLSAENKSTTIIHLGDHTNLGLVADLQQSYDTLSYNNAPFYAIPGDRDLWETSGPANFSKVFGETKHSFTQNDIKFVVFDNSMNFSSIPQDDMTWFLNEVKDADFVFLSQPLYHPSNKVMGVFEGKEVVNVKKQADELLSAIRESNVKAVFAAEHHLSSETQDPERSTLMHYVIGAVTKTINDRPQSILQTPRFSILKISPDGTYAVEEKIL